MKRTIVVLLASAIPAIASVTPFALTTNITSNILTSNVPTRILRHTNGDISIAGQEVGGGLAVLRFTANGTRSWVSRYRGTTNTPNERPAALAADGQGNLFVAAASLNDQTNDDYVTIKLDAAGQPQWVRRYDSPNHGADVPRAMAVDAQGNVVVTGRALVSTGQIPQGNVINWEFRTIKYSAAGDALWSMGHAMTGGYHEGQCVAIDSNGNVYVGGKVTTYYDLRVSETKLGIVKYNASGVGQWAWNELVSGNGGLGAEQSSLGIDEAGDIYFGVTGRYGLGSAYTIYKISQTSARLWTQAYAPYSGLPPEHAIAGLALDRRNVFVTGWSRGSNGLSIATLALAQSNGAIQWEDRYLAATNVSNANYAINYARQVLCDGAGGAFVTGITRTTNGTELVTIHYDENGRRKWVAPLPASESATNLTQYLCLADGVPLLVAPSPGGPSNGTDHLVWRLNPHGAWISAAAKTSFLLRFVGSPGQTNRVQYASELGHWTDMGQTVADAEGVSTFSDTNPTGVAKRFYRLVSP